MFSLEEKEAVNFVREIREVEQAIKDTERKLNPDLKKGMLPEEVFFPNHIFKKGQKSQKNTLNIDAQVWSRTRRTDDICFKMAKKDIPAGTMIGLDQVM